MANEARGRGISVTIKYGKGYEESWAGFTGLAHEVREDLIGYFGLDRESVAELTLSELVVNVTSLAHGKAVASAVLGAVAIPGSAPDGEPRGDDAWAAAEGSGGQQAAPQPEPATSPLLGQIAACEDVPALQRLWAEHQAAFADADLMAAYKARGRALQESA